MARKKIGVAENLIFALVFRYSEPSDILKYLCYKIILIYVGSRKFERIDSLKLENLRNNGDNELLMIKRQAVLSL